MKKEVFEYKDYRELMKEHFMSLPKQGFGQLSKAAEKMNIHPSFLTSILNESKNMTTEQALDFADFAQMTELEADYFLHLVLENKSGTQKLKSHYQKKLTELKNKSAIIKNRLPPTVELSESAKAQFYSQWYYSAIRNCASLPQIKTVENFVDFLYLPRPLVVQVLEFLVSQNLVVLENGNYSVGPQSTHIGAGELLVTRHHTNWRLKAIEKLNQDSVQGLHFTSPLTIGEKDIPEVRKILLKTLDEIFDLIDVTEPDRFQVLCVDWFRL
jgi:uncharacterized protein (TIGR02147 family)